MAVRRTGAQRTGNGRRKPAGRAAPKGRHSRVPVATVFWILFFIVLIIAFFALLPTVRKGGTGITAERPAPPIVEQETPPPPQSTRQEQPAVTQTTERTPVETPTERLPAADPPQEQIPPERPAGQTSSQPEGPPVSQPPDQPPASTSTERPAETRDRAVYFMQEINDGAELLLTRVNRRLPASDSPLFDSLNALLAGPTADEKNRSIINFIPPGTRLVSKPSIRGNTAIIDFSEEFQYNPDGREGLVAQLRQIVWTATEFPSVHDVQILIEGRRVAFLGEGIMIGSPLRR